MGNFFNGFTASALRSVLVLAMLVPLALAGRAFQPLRLRHTWPYLLGMFVGSVVNWGPLYYATLHAGVGISTTVAYAGIVIGMFVFGSLFAGEHFTKDKAVSGTLGLAGLALMILPSLSSLGPLAIGAAFISGLSTASGSVFAKCLRYNATQSTIAVWVISATGNIAMAALFRTAFPIPSLRIEWLYLVFFAIASIIASWTFLKGLKLIDAGAAGILGLLEIVFGFGFGIVLFHEHPSVLALLGGGVIIVAAAVPYFKDFNLKRGTLE